MFQYCGQLRRCLELMGWGVFAVIGRAPHGRCEPSVADERCACVKPKHTEPDVTRALVDRIAGCGVAAALSVHDTLGYTVLPHPRDGVAPVSRALEAAGRYARAKCRPRRAVAGQYGGLLESTAWAASGARGHQEAAR